MSLLAAADPIALLTHARSVPAPDRERFARRVRQTPGQYVLLETCHRVEVYAIGDGPVVGLADGLPAGGVMLRGESATAHVIAVAAGADSVVVGEDQVLHQVRNALDLARAAGSLDPALERLVTLALRAGREARSWRTGPRRSLADLALDLIERRVGPLAEQRILVVGAGRMGRLAAHAGVRRSGWVTIANRSRAGAIALAQAVGGQSTAFDPGVAVAAFGGIVVALSGRWDIAESTSDALAAGSTVVIDLSAPPAVSDQLAARLGPRIVLADTLAVAGIEPTSIGEPRVADLIARTTAEFGAWQRGHAGRSAAAALVARADHEREAELAALWRRLPDLSPEVRREIERMTGHLARRLLREPLERLGRSGGGPHEQAVRDLFAL